MYSSVAYDMVSCDFKQRSDVPNQTEAGVSASSSAVVRSALPTSFGCLVGITPQVEESTVNSNHEAMKCTLFHTEGKVLNVTSKL